MRHCAQENRWADNAEDFNLPVQKIGGEAEMKPRNRASARIVDAGVRNGSQSATNR
jgi:hypothetical protein